MPKIKSRKKSSQSSSKRKESERKSPDILTLNLTMTIVVSVHSTLSPRKLVGVLRQVLKSHLGPVSLEESHFTQYLSTGGWLKTYAVCSFRTRATSLSKQMQASV